MNHKIHIVSFPRSGQHLLERILLNIFTYYNIDFSYCEFYNVCSTIDCKNKCIFQKNHDFDLDFIQQNEKKYIILYRKDIIYQLESWFRLKFFGKEVYHKQVHYNNIDLYTGLVSFIKSKMNYYDGFVNKWVKNNLTDNKIIIDYDNFILNQKENIFRIIKFLGLKQNLIPRNYINVFYCVKNYSYKKKRLIKNEDIIEKSEDSEKNIPIIERNLEKDVEIILSLCEKIEYKNRLNTEVYNKIKKDLSL